MSSLPTFNAANAEGQLNLNYIFSILPFAILYYDYALTFTQEVELFWPIHDRLGWVSSIFLLSRYFAILGNIPILLSYVVNDGSTCSCRSIPIFLPFHQGFTLCFISILCSVRVYALYNKSRVALGIVACASFGLTVTGIVTVATSKPVVPLRVSQPIIPGCMSNLVLSPYETERLLFPWSGVLVFDSIVFALTLRKTIQLGTRTHIIQVMFRDGAMYFGVLFLVNLTNILVLRV
ncbi:hypothetical protein BC834DRAFT_551641 [Gloeopeniophorella convolvens]|nr:hypothetical protein BC834DRAFT_551641 [Gloeopeniophorella convolvens]